MTTENNIKTIADAVQMLTCMVGTPEHFDEEARIWWRHKLELIHKEMGDIINNDYKMH